MAEEPKNEIFINCHADVPSLPDWTKAGMPKVWLSSKSIHFGDHSTKYSDIKIWQDMAFGGLMVDIDGRKYVGKNEILAEDFAIFGPAWGFPELAVFKRLGSA